MESEPVKGRKEWEDLAFRQNGGGVCEGEVYFEVLVLVGFGYGIVSRREAVRSTCLSAG